MTVMSDTLNEPIDDPFSEEMKKIKKVSRIKRIKKVK